VFFAKHADIYSAHSLMTLKIVPRFCQQHRHFFRVFSNYANIISAVSSNMIIYIFCFLLMSGFFAENTSNVLHYGNYAKICLLFFAEYAAKCLLSLLKTPKNVQRFCKTS